MSVATNFADSSSLCSYSTLAQLRNELQNWDAPMSLPSIFKLLECIGLESDVVDAEFVPDEKNYRRNTLFESSHALLVAITWLPGQSSPVHNHSGSACGVKVVDGTATETKFVRVCDGKAIQCGTTQSHEVGEVFGGQGSDDLHVVANCGPRTLKTLHLYSPPLRRENMQIFEEIVLASENAGGIS